MLVGACVLVVALFLASTFVRRRLIARGKPLTLCAMRDARPQRPGGYGLSRYGSSRVEWFPLGGLRCVPPPVGAHPARASARRTGSTRARSRPR